MGQENPDKPGKCRDVASEVKSRPVNRVKIECEWASHVKELKGYQQIK
jgi:hypothetical protein